MSFSLCTTNLDNTGAIQCDVSPGIPSKLFIWNGSKAISTISGDNFQAFLEASSKKSKTDSDKLFVFPEIQDVADATEANTTGTLNLGFSTVLREGKPSYTFKVFAGQSLVPKLRSFNNQSVRVLMLDTNNRVWGVKSGSNFVGAQAKIFVGGLKYASGQNVEEGVVTITISYLSATEFNDSAAYGDIDSASDITGLMDVSLEEYDTAAANVHKIKAYVPTAELGGEINLYDVLGATLADTDLWTAKTGTGYTTALTITSIAANATASGYDFTFDSTAYTALDSGATIKLAGVAPETLDGSDVTGVEIGYIILTKA